MSTLRAFNLSAFLSSLVWNFGFTFCTNAVSTGSVGAAFVSTATTRLISATSSTLTATLTFGTSSITKWHIILPSQNRLLHNLLLLSLYLLVLIQLIFFL